MGFKIIVCFLLVAVLVLLVAVNVNLGQLAARLPHY